MLISGIFISKKFGKIKTRKSNQYLIGRRSFINLVTTNYMFELYALNTKVLFDVNFHQIKGNIFITCTFITT